MKQQDEAITRALAAAEKIADQYLKLDTENIDKKRIAELLTEALAVVELCEQVLGINHPGTMELYYEIGSMYDYAKDYPRAVEWYTKAAEHGHDDAQCSLALSHHLGKGVKKNPAKAIEWYTKAAEKENEIALFELGEIYQYGQGVEVNHAKAAEWYTKAAEKGDELAYREVACCLYTIEEYDKALSWAEKAVKEYPEDHFGIYYLASIYQALGRKEEALSQFELCLKLEEEQQAGNEMIDDEMINETKDRIRELKNED